MNLQNLKLLCFVYQKLHLCTLPTISFPSLRFVMKYQKPHKQFSPETRQQQRDLFAKTGLKMCFATTLSCVCDKYIHMQGLRTLTHQNNKLIKNS